jgi:hypothetical protein
LLEGWGERPDAVRALLSSHPDADQRPSVPEDEILQLVAAELAAFDDARFRKYTPVLEEGSVLRELRRTAHEHDTHHLVAW